MNVAKSNLILAVAAVVLAVPTALSLRGERELFKDVAIVPKLFEGFTPDNVGVVVLGEPKANQPAAPAGQTPADPNQKKQVERDLLQIVRTDKGWGLGQGAGDITGAPVDQKRVEDDVMKHLSEIRADRESLVVADATDEQLAQYNLTEEKAMLLQVFDRTPLQPQQIAALFVGKNSNEGKAGTEGVQGVFVRRADSRDVVLYEVPYWRRDVKHELWLDKKILQAEPDKVLKIAWKNQAGGGQEIVLQRKKEANATWECPAPPPEVGPLKQMEVEQFVQRLRYVFAQEYKRPLQASNLKELGLASPLVTVAVTLKEGEAERTVTMNFGTKVDGKNEVYAQVGENPFLLTFPQHMTAPFERDPKELFEPPVSPAPGEQKAGGAAPGTGEKKDEPKKDEPGKEAPKKN
jgi:hypothetical protein